MKSSYLFFLSYYHKDKLTSGSAQHITVDSYFCRTLVEVNTNLIGAFLLPIRAGRAYL